MRSAELAKDSNENCQAAQNCEEKHIRRFAKQPACVVPATEALKRLQKRPRNEGGSKNILCPLSPEEEGTTVSISNGGTKGRKSRVVVSCPLLT